MKTIDELKIELSRLELQINPLLERKEQASRELSKAMSLEFIRANKIKKRYIHNPDDYFRLFGNWGHETKFIEHIRALPISQRRKWTSWNGIIYSTNSLLSGEWISTPSWLDDVKE